MARLMIRRDLFKQMSKLPGRICKAIGELVDKFQSDPTNPQLYFHSVKESMRDSKVRGAKLPDGYRAIIIAPEQGDSYLLVHVDTHDEAYAWAKNKLFEVHGGTGNFQIVDVPEIESAQEQIKQVQPAAKPGYALARLDADQLFVLGVPKPLIPAIKAIASDEEFEALSQYLPPDCREVLTGVAAGMSPDDAIAAFVASAPEAKPPVGGGDFTGMESRPSYEFITIDGERELLAILSRPLEEWRLFLHPSQRRLVNWDRPMPICITGAAGTGKTVCLMHRAVRLARQLPEGTDRVLFTTFTRNLSITIADLLKSLCPDRYQRIEITNLHRLAGTICSNAGWKGHIADEAEMQEVWSDVWADPTITAMPLDRAEVRREFEEVVDPNGVLTEDDYLTVVRTDRPRIGRKERKQLWPVFAAVRRLLDKRNLMTFEGCLTQARQVVEKKRYRTFAHVLVDEVQDFSLEALRLIAALAPIPQQGSATPTMNALTLAGDGHQRIYRTKVPMRRAGIDIVGRSRRLVINYRTTEQIRDYAQRILAGVPIDDLDDGTTSTVGDHSLRSGPKPTVIRCADTQDEAKRIVTWIQGLLNQTDPALRLATHEICITPVKDSILAALTAAGIARYILPNDQPDHGQEQGIRLASMHRIKGLEYRAIIMACADPADPMNNPTTASLRQRCERYVAATRARDHLLVCINV